MESLESRCKHLFDVSSVIKGNSHLAILLKSYLLTQCVKLTLNNIKLPHTIFGSHIRCSKCCTSWSENKFTIKAKEKLTKSAKKRYKMRIKKSHGSNTKIIEAHQQLYGKNMIATCHVCNKNTEINLGKDQVEMKCKKVTQVNEKHNINKSSVPIQLKSTKVTTKNDKNILDNAKEKENKFGKPKSNSKHNKETRDSFYLSSNTVLKIENKKPIEAKPIKKRLKDKYAGLCKLAVQSTRTSNAAIERVSKNTQLELLLKRI